jgi:autotransporter-associated beta strand protein
MKTSSLALLIILGLAHSPAAFAAERYWYGSEADCIEGSGGRNGIWNNASTSWKTVDDGICAEDRVAWTSGDDAVFTQGGSATVIIRDNNPTVNRVWVKEGGFLFMATASGRTMTLTSGRFTVDSGSVTVGRSLTDPAHNIVITVPGTGPSAGTFVVDGAGRLFARVSSAGFVLNAVAIHVTGGGIYHFNNGNGWGTAPESFTSDFMVISNNSTVRIGTITSGGVNRGITIGDGGGRIQASANNTISAPITGTAPLTIQGDSILTFSADNSSFTGPINITETATLAITNGSAIHDSCEVNIAGTTAAILRVNTSETIARVTGGSATAGSVTLNGVDVALTVGDDTDFTYSGNMTGAGNLIKAGSGTMTMTRNTTFGGGTTVGAGTLLVNNTTGSGLGIGAVTVEPSGTLGGTGTISGTALIGGTVSPGTRVGTLTTGGQTWSGGGTYKWEMNDAFGAMGQDPGWDTLTINGALNIAATSGSKFTIDITSLAGSAPGNAANYASNVEYTWTILTTTDGISGFDPAAFNVTTTNFSNSLGNASFSIAQDGNDLVIISSSIPPSAPAITSQPQNRTNVLGTSATFTVAASGSQPLTYHWFYETFGNPVGGNSPTYTRTNVQPEHAGRYFAWVTNSMGNATSSFANLVVAPVPSVQPLAGTGTGAVTITWPTVGGNTYQVLYSTNLATTNWFVLTNVAGTGGIRSVVDNPPPGDPQRYYRLRIQ